MAVNDVFEEPVEQVQEPTEIHQEALATSAPVTPAPTKTQVTAPFDYGTAAAWALLNVGALPAGHYVLASAAAQPCSAGSLLAVLFAMGLFLAGCLAFFGVERRKPLAVYGIGALAILIAALVVLPDPMFAKSFSASRAQLDRYADIVVAGGAPASDQVGAFAITCGWVNGKSAAFLLPDGSYLCRYRSTNLVEVGKSLGADWRHAQKNEFDPLASGSGWKASTKWQMIPAPKAYITTIPTSQR